MGGISFQIYPSIPLGILQKVTKSQMVCRSSHDGLSKNNILSQMMQ